jgi:hypothetical protein
LFFTVTVMVGNTSKCDFAFSVGWRERASQISGATKTLSLRPHAWTRQNAYLASN